VEPSSLASSQIAVVARSPANVLYLLAGQRRLLADFVAEIGDQYSEAADAIF
jgi:hypothetical protein